MNRVMMSALALVATSLLAGALHAGDDAAAKEAATKFLESQTAVNEGILGPQTLAVRMLGQDVGKMTLDIEKGEYEGKACYVLTTNGEVDMGTKTTITGKSYIAPNLTLLQGEETEKEGDKLSKHELYTVKDGVLHAEFKQPLEKDESKHEQNFEIKQQPGLLIASAEMLVTVVLPREAGKKYQFTRWSSDADKTYPLLVECVGDAKLGDKQVFKIVEHDKKFKDDGTGNFVSEDKDSVLWFDAHKLVRMDAIEGFALTTEPAPTRTPITREMIEKQDDPAAVMAGFFLASNDQDEELMDALVNQLKLMRHSLDENPRTKGMSDSDKDSLAQMYAGTLIKSILKNGKTEGQTDEEKARSKKMVQLLLNKENFVVEKKDDIRIVRFKDEVTRSMGKLQFTLEKNDDGKWEITLIKQLKDDEAKPEDKKGDEKKDDEKKDEKKDDEDGF